MAPHPFTSRFKCAAPLLDAMIRCANPGRGGYRAAMEAANEVFRCRETAGRMFGCTPEQVVFTSNCTHGLNIAIRTLVKPGANVVISGFEHNAVTRTLYGLGAVVHTAGGSCSIGMTPCGNLTRR